MTGQETSAEVEPLLDKTSCPLMSKTADHQHQPSREALVNILPPVAAPRRRLSSSDRKYHPGCRAGVRQTSSKFSNSERDFLAVARFHLSEKARK